MTEEPIVPLTTKPISLFFTDFGNYNGKEVCLFCGKEIKSKWDENTSYFECDCAEAVKNRKIDEEIDELRRQKVKPKYATETKKVLKKL